MLAYCAGMVVGGAIVALSAIGANNNDRHFWIILSVLTALALAAGTGFT